MIISSWNVNSVRARIENIKSYLLKYKPDIVMMQEIKTEDVNFPYDDFSAMDYESHVFGQKSYNGVAIISKGKLKNIRTDLIKDKLKQSRIISAELEYKKKNIQLIHISSDKKIISVVNKIAPEHLELNIKNYKSLVPKIKNSGSICLGKYAVMAMTDYNVGSNHVLPTNGSAKYSSGISVNEFYKRISYINLSKKGIESLGPSVITLANYEGLVGHAQSVVKRIRRK